MDARITGGCLCGAVRYDAAGPIVAARACWCRVCQYLACGSASINVIVPTADLRVEGALSDYRSVADSGSRMTRRFCPSCGTHVFSAADTRPNLVVVRAGTLDDPALGAPAGVIWAKSAPAWACFDPALPREDGQPAPVG
ncbi:GFA family protein [Sphingosinicella sp. BN140058]|uniref:GFA family protein n=1 Tax=Sphingosinicella sp. BN140058 TaxID=1892855 RepID=UPI0010123B9F|nr:GFA family protein [Sphingosinicella sp. BN140058]QAY78695.1 aldehyde-activating protein [Sphingosinicella sp. BN140058]